MVPSVAVHGPTVDITFSLLVPFFLFLLSRLNTAPSFPGMKERILWSQVLRFFDSFCETILTLFFL